MKIKSFLLISVLLMLSACGGKKEQGGQAEGLAKIEQEWKDIPIKVENGPESYTHEDDDQPMATAPEEDWTEEAVEKRIREYFDAVNKTFADGSTLSPFDLDKQFYTNYWNEVYEEVNAKDGRQKTTESCFFVDDNHWTGGLDTPVEVKDVKVELLTGETAEAVFTLVEKEGGISQKVVLALDYQRGLWCINDWLKKSHDPAGSMLSKMEKYIGL